VEITQRVLVDGEVNRARSMPQNASIVAAKTCNSEVYVFDFAKKRGDGCDPDFRLKGHDKEGYGLSWSTFKNGYLLSGSNDNKICLWDVFGASENKVLDAVHVYEVMLLRINLMCGLLIWSCCEINCCFDDGIIELLVFVCVRAMKVMSKMCLGI
jgi:WD40 repeat protein